VSQELSDELDGDDGNFLGFFLVENGLAAAGKVAEVSDPLFTFSTVHPLNTGSPCRFLFNGEYGILN